MDVNLFDYVLPEELIAQEPLENRVDSRMLVLEKISGAMEHRRFYEIADMLGAGDCLVINDTKVLPARLMGEKIETGAKIEVLLLKRRADSVWEALVKPGKKARPGAKISFGGGMLTGMVLKVEEDGNRLIQFRYEGIFEELLEQLGQMPLPPYITHCLEDRSRYQTVYAKHTGSAAAPTAGFHFTQELLECLKAKSVTVVPVTLHVGLGTFRPVKAEQVEAHHMHTEFYRIGQEEAHILNEARKAGKRIIAVGTTSCRALESAADETGQIVKLSGWTDIFIYPGYRFRTVEALITNFHLPKSTLMMLVSALAGREHIMPAYEEAIKERYRFFSFGDCMFIC